MGLKEKNEKVYRGRRWGSGWSVVVEEDGKERLLSERLDLLNHSPDSLSWGYGGSGPAQTALAILAHHLGEEREEEALRLYQCFKLRVIALLPQNEPWSMSAEYVDGKLEECRASMPRPRDHSGLFRPTDLDAICRCGHPYAVHSSGAPFACVEGFVRDGQPEPPFFDELGFVSERQHVGAERCRCQHFQRIRKAKQGRERP